MPPSISGKLTAGTAEARSPTETLSPASTGTSSCCSSCMAACAPPAPARTATSTFSQNSVLRGQALQPLPGTWPCWPPQQDKGAWLADVSNARRRGYGRATAPGLHPRGLLYLPAGFSPVGHGVRVAPNLRKQPAVSSRLRPSASLQHTCQIDDVITSLTALRESLEGDIIETTGPAYPEAQCDERTCSSFEPRSIRMPINTNSTAMTAIDHHACAGAQDTPQVCSIPCQDARPIFNVRSQDARPMFTVRSHPRLPAQALWTYQRAFGGGGPSRGREQHGAATSFQSV